jgi:glycosyltransferase involved in cell wall biosynthesis
MKNGKKPLISVVTVCFNSEKSIIETIESVINQTYENIEYILVDGSSTDATVKIIESYENKTLEKDVKLKWVSEPDKGVYDAMNKALKLATGKWGIFMNSGDCFYDKNVIKEIFVDPFSKEDFKFIIGDTLRKYTDSTFLSSPTFFCDPIKGMGFSHQSVFFDVFLHKNKPFSYEYMLMADFDFFCKCVKENTKFLQVPVVISIFETGGISRTKWKLNIIERYSIFKKYKNNRKTKDYLLFINIVSRFLIVTFLGEGRFKKILKILKK